MNDWIKCSDRMPNECQAVILCCSETDDNEGPWIAAGFVWEGQWITQDGSGLNNDSYIHWPVSHWMPLPEPPRDTP